MRIDVALKHLCIVKSRSSAKSLCDDDGIKINGKSVKASASVRPGDRVTIVFPQKTLIIEIVEVPKKQLSKSLSQTYYRNLESA